MNVTAIDPSTRPEVLRQRDARSASKRSLHGVLEEDDVTEEGPGVHAQDEDARLGGQEEGREEGDDEADQIVALDLPIF